MTKTTYRYRTVWTGTCDHLLKDGTYQHSEMVNAASAWCKSEENARKNFLKGMKENLRHGDIVDIREWHIEKKLM